MHACCVLVGVYFANFTWYYPCLDELGHHVAHPSSDEVSLIAYKRLWMILPMFTLVQQGSSAFHYRILGNR
jgi:hypothetical protein